jgi:hypothetical protein
MNKWMIILKIASWFLIWAAAALTGNYVGRKIFLKGEWKALKEANEAFMKNITADHVRVIRCQDCKHFAEYTDEYRWESDFDGDCVLLAGYTDCDKEARKYTDYCSAAEAMETEVKEDD